MAAIGLIVEPGTLWCSTSGVQPSIAMFRTVCAHRKPFAIWACGVIVLFLHRFSRACIGRGALFIPCLHPSRCPCRAEGLTAPSAHATVTATAQPSRAPYGCTGLLTQAALVQHGI